MSLSVFLWFAQYPVIGGSARLPAPPMGQVPAAQPAVPRGAGQVSVAAPLPVDLQLGGAYAGLTLAPQARNPLPPPKANPVSLLWTGFSPGDGTGGEIFLQTTRPVEHEITVAKAPRGKSALSVLLRNCRIHARNNARRIDTSFFATPVNGVFARQRKRDVELSIQLKHAAAPQIRRVPGPDGSELLVLSFPAVTALAPAAPATVGR